MGNGRMKRGWGRLKKERQGQRWDMERGRKGREKERRKEGGGEIWKRGKEKGLGRSKRGM